ncbi:protein odr-4 homolog [Halichoeres trimaculatus]|uniref:protein odr-4 homolog n=1 Tax=Halichoeres trimaculatus TaxID=147232 RepID=UPI003D9E8D04
MGRGCVAEDTLEGYLSRLCGQPACTVTGLLIGQSSVQKNYVLMAARTPPREDSSAASRNSVDKEWVTEHARQVSRMLPGGLSVIGVFIINDNDAKDTVATLQHLVFAVENLISSEHLWIPSDDDITDRIALHINPKTGKTFDVRDPKSTAKPADWKYSSGVCSSWSTVSCRVDVDMMVSLPDNRTSTEGLSKDLKDERSSLVIQPCGGSVSVRGAIHSTALVHNNKPKARLAEKLLKRDVVSTVVTRVQMVLEELLISEEEGRSKKETVKGSGPVCVCDYQFSDEDLSEVTDRLTEMLDINVAEADLDDTRETPSELMERDFVTGR